MLKKFWYPLASSQEIKKNLVKRRLFDVPLVLMKDSQGEVVCFKDLCPHRNAPLSLGTVHQGQLVCAYHGWQFDGQGKVQKVPSQIPGSALPKKCLQKYHTVEKDGTVWVNLDEKADTQSLNSWPVLPGYSSFELINTLQAPLDLVLENFVDCAHTPFVHKGLFRSPSTQILEASIEESPRGVHIVTHGEKTQKSLLSAFLNSKQEEIFHKDEYLYPSTVEVNYKWGERRHICTVSISTPLSKNETMIFTRVYLKSTVAQALTSHVIKYITKKILNQDVIILEGQASAIAHEGQESFTGVASDAPISRVRNAYKSLEAGKISIVPQRSLTISYQI